MTEKAKLPLTPEGVAHQLTILSYLIKQGMSIKLSEEITRYIAVPEPDIITVFYDKKNPDTLDFSVIKNGIRVRIFLKFNKENQRFVPEKMQIFPLRAFE